MNGGNPYGAVPDALKETRLTLRDLMASHMENKVLEGRLGLEKSKAETEVKMIEAGIKRDELASLRDADRLTQQDRQFTLGQAQTVSLADAARKERAGEFGANTANRALEREQTQANADRQFLLDKAKADREAKEASLLDKIEPLGKRAAGIGIHPDVLTGLGHDPNMNISGRDWKVLGERVTAQINKAPGLGIWIDMRNTEAKISDIHKQLQQPGIDSAKATQLHAEEKRLGSVLKAKHDLYTAANPPDETRILEIASKDYRIAKEKDDTKFLETYPTLGDYAQAVRDAGIKGRTAMDNLKALHITGLKLDVDPNYDQIETAASAAIKAKATPTQAASIAAGFNQLTGKGDFSGALEYLTGHAKKLSGGDKGLVPGPVVSETNPAESTSTLKTIAAARRAEVVARRLEDAKIAAAKRIEDAAILKERAKNFREVNKGWIP